MKTIIATTATIIALAAPAFANLNALPNGFTQDQTIGALPNGYEQDQTAGNTLPNGYDRPESATR